jgi:hypothetical protein
MDLERNCGRIIEILSKTEVYSESNEETRDQEFENNPFGIRLKKFTAMPTRLDIRY